MMTVLAALRVKIYKRFLEKYILKIIINLECLKQLRHLVLEYHVTLVFGGLEPTSTILEFLYRCFKHIRTDNFEY